MYEHTYYHQRINKLENQQDMNPKFLNQYYTLREQLEKMCDKIKTVEAILKNKRIHRKTLLLENYCQRTDQYGGFKPNHIYDGRF